MTRRRITVALTVAFVALVVAVIAARVQLGLRVYEQLAERRMAADPLGGLADGLHVGLCGAGSPLPDERRSGPCTVVVAGERIFLFDAGANAARNLVRMGFNPGEIEALFLTHFHSDHIDGLGEVMLQRWVGGSRAEPLPVHGPAGVDGVVAGFVQAYTPDQGYRVAHHGAAVVPPAGFGGVARAFDVAEPDGRVVVLDEPDLEIVAFSVQHDPVHPAVGYRIRYKDRTAVLSGDTRSCPAVVREARGVDLLVHEALSPTLVGVLERSAAQAGRSNMAAVFHDIPGYHTTPEQAAATARDAGVGFLLLNHIAPALPLPGQDQVFLGDAGRIFAGPIKVGIDGDFLSLPAGSKAIEAGRRP
jgi:ribonuclease Z